MRVRDVLLSIAVVTVVTGCRHNATMHPDDEAVIKYGYGPQPNPHVKYQPDVVMIGDGPKAIRTVSPDNFTWTIDGRAKGASELGVGKIMFATSRAVGRVIAIQPRGSDLAVTVLPVQLTEVIRDADLKISTRVNPGEMVYHESLPPENKAELQFPIQPGVLRPAVWRSSARGPRLRLVGSSPSKKMTAKLKLGSWEVEPYYRYKGVSGTSDDDIQASYQDQNPNPFGGKQPDPNAFTKPTGKPELNPGTGQLEQGRQEERTDEIGLKIQYIVGGGKWQFEEGGKVSNGLKFGGSVRLSGENIRVRSHIVIANGQVQGPSTFVIDGIDRLHVGLLGGIENGVGDNVKTRIEVPAEFTQSIPPEATNGIPFAVQVKFKFIVETAFSGGNSTLWTHGDYRLSGPIGYENGSPVSPTFEVEHPMMNDLHGIAIGVSGMVIAVEVRWLVGLGTETAMIGPYGKLIVAAGVTKGSILAMGLGGLKGGPTCRSVTLKGDLGIGIGVIVDTSWFGKAQMASPADGPFGLIAKNLKKTELELFESSFSWYNKGWFAPDIPLCRPGG